METQTKTAKEILTHLAREYEIKSRQLTKGIVELVDKINAILKPTGLNYRPFDTVDQLPSLCWWSGNVRRCKWYEPQVYNGELVLRCNVSYSGSPDWYQEYAETINGLAKERKYNVIKEIAIWTIKLLQKLAKHLKEEKENIEFWNDEIEKLINALKA